LLRVSLRGVLQRIVGVPRHGRRQVHAHRAASHLPPLHCIAGLWIAVGLMAVLRWGLASLFSLKRWLDSRCR